MNNDNKRITSWINTLLSEISENESFQGEELLNVCGKACSESSSFYKGAIKIAAEFKNEPNLNKRFNAFKSRYYDSENFRMEDDQITLILDECTCPIVKAGINNPYICNCTVGYSKNVFETLFEKEVSVELKESILNDDNKCRQIISIKDK